MIRYYAGNAAYRLRGAPQTAMRLLGPLLVLSTVGVLGTGVALLVAGPQTTGSRGLHSLAFIAFFATCGVHVLVHVWRVPFLASLDWRPRGAAARLDGAPPARGRVRDRRPRVAASRWATTARGSPASRRTTATSAATASQDRPYTARRASVGASRAARTAG